MVKGKKITSLSALTLFGIISLPKRICELVADGHKVKKVRKTVEKEHGGKARIVVYSL